MRCDKILILNKPRAKLKFGLHFYRSHAPRGNAFLDAPRPLD